MADQTNADHNEVKVEDLLRLKRAERPSAAFWGEFDRELHQRMLRTLVKKDPWHVQVVRGLSGRFVQSAAVVSAAAFIALMVVRPAFIGSSGTGSVSLGETTRGSIAAASSAVAMGELDTSMVSAHDYQIDSISAEKASRDVGVTRDFGMEGFQFAYDSSDYSIDSTYGLPAFGSTGVASLVY